MRKISALIAILLVNSSLLMAQNDKVSGDATPPPIVKPSRDFFMLQFGYSNWVQKPDSINLKPFNYVFNMFLCYDFPIKKTRLSFATGIGISTSVTYLNSMVISSSDTGVLGYEARFLPDTGANGRYKRYKFGTTYLQAPFELRYFANKLNRNKGFKAAIGMQVGTLMGAHTKGLKAVEGTNVKDKVDTKRYLSPWNFAATARVGWGNFSLFGSYNLTNIYKDNAGPVITPASIGFCLTGL
jgi:hypothetical protein